MAATPPAAQNHFRKFNKALLKLAMSRTLSHAGFAAAVEEITQTAARALEVERVSVWLLRNQSHQLECLDLYEAGSEVHSRGAALNADDYPIYFSALLENRAIAAHDALEDPRTGEFSQDYLMPLKIVSMLDAPIRSEGRMIGVLCHEHTGQPRRWSPEEESFAGSVADVTALVIEAHDRREAQSQLQRTHDHLERRVNERTQELMAINEKLQQEILSRKQMEEALRQSQKLEAIGTLAGGIAHDFNNMLAAIMSNTDLLKILTRAHPEAYESAEAIEQVSKRAAALTKQLLGFARRGKYRDLVNNLHEIIEETAQLIRRAVNKNILLQVDLHATRTLVQGDPDQLQQALLNLLVNARDAMPLGGKIAVTTENTTRPAGGLPTGDYLKITVQDSGAGIPAALVERIFEPFFSTKEPGKGTGMGLAMVYGIVKNHGGHIEVITTEGQGARFEVVLPLTAEAGETKMVEQTASPVTGHGCILVVDDERAVREAVAKLLRELGYETLTAADCQQALELYAARKNKIDLVILDMIMPGKSGHECFQALKRLNPTVRAVLATGYGLNAEAKRALEEGMADFILKPFQMAQLSNVVARAIAHPDDKAKR